MARLAAGQRLLASIVVVAAVLLLASPVLAGVLDVTWNAPTTTADGDPLTNLESYRVYYGTPDSPCPTSSFLTVPLVTSASAPDAVISVTLTGLIAKAVYFVQVTAVDACRRQRQ